MAQNSRIQVWQSLEVTQRAQSYPHARTKILKTFREIVQIPRADTYWDVKHSLPRHQRFKNHLIWILYG